MKEGSNVKINTRKRTGTGIVQKVRTTLKGLFYDVKLSTGETLSFRAANLALA